MKFKNVQSLNAVHIIANNSRINCFISSQQAHAAASSAFKITAHLHTAGLITINLNAMSPLRSHVPPSKASQSPLLLSTGRPLGAGPVERAAAFSGQIAAAAVLREVAAAVVVQQVAAQAMFQGAVIGVAEGVVRLEDVAPAVQQVAFHLVLWLCSPLVIDCRNGTCS